MVSPTGIPILFELPATGFTGSLLDAQQATICSMRAWNSGVVWSWSMGLGPVYVWGALWIPPPLPCTGMPCHGMVDHHCHPLCWMMLCINCYLLGQWTDKVEGC